MGDTDNPQIDSRTVTSVNGDKTSKGPRKRNLSVEDTDRAAEEAEKKKRRSANSQRRPGDYYNSYSSGSRR
jgi:hypothetical protein